MCIFNQADDDTYLIVENLRHMLQSYDPNEAIWFGCKYHPYVERGYMSGGAGYVLSKEAMNRFVETGINDTTGNRLTGGLLCVYAAVLSIRNKTSYYH